VPLSQFIFPRLPLKEVRGRISFRLDGYVEENRRNLFCVCFNSACSELWSRAFFGSPQVSPVLVIFNSMTMSLRSIPPSGVRRRIAGAVAGVGSVIGLGWLPRRTGGQSLSTIRNSKRCPVLQASRFRLEFSSRQSPLEGFQTGHGLSPSKGRRLTFPLPLKIKL